MKDGQATMTRPTTYNHSNATIWTQVGSDNNYEWYRTHDTFKELRAWMDKAYYKENLLLYLDDSFLDQLRNHDFFARLWELELAEWLFLTKLKLVPTKGFGPDFCIDMKNRKVWIEAILATPDEDLISIHEAMLKSGGMYDYPSHQMTLRYSSALFTKATKIKKSYIDKGLIGSEDIVLIAISGFPPTGALSPDIEHFQRAIIPMGDPVIHLTTDGSPLDGSIPRTTHTSMPSQKKKNGATVLKQFLYPGDNFPFIDGVLFTEASNLQSLLGVISSGFGEFTNIPHIFPNYSSKKIIPTMLTDNFYIHKFVDNRPLISLETIDPKIKLM